MAQLPCNPVIERLWGIRRFRRLGPARGLTVLVICALVTLAGDLPAQQGTENQSGPLQGDSITLNLQDVDIRALINMISQVTEKNFLVDSRVKGKVTLVSGQKLNAEQIYQVFLSVLEVHQLAAVDSGGIIKIIPKNIVKQQPTPTSFTSNLKPGDQQLTQVYQLKHGAVQDLLPILKPLLPPTSHFAPHVSTNTLVFTDTAANIERILSIIAKLDQPARRSEIHVVYLKFAQASEMVQILTQLASGMRKTADPKQKRAPSDLTVQADDNLNALIIQSPVSEFQLLRAVIDQLDIARPDEGNIHVVYLKHATAADLVDILNNVVSTRVSAAKDAKPLASSVSIQAEESTNALVIRAADDEFRTLRNVIDKLDLKRQQVFVETIIAAVQANKAADLGVEWQGLYSPDGGGEISGETSFSDIEGGLAVGFINQLVGNIFGNIVPDLQVVLRALRSDSNTNILSTPNLLTLENETAEIVVGQEVPFVTGQFSTDTGATTTTAPGDGSGTATTSVNPFQTIERKNVGITLRITPQINEGDNIRLEIEQEVSNVNTTTVAGAADLITDTRSIKATVQVDDGKIIVLGGLIQDDFQDTVEWVPILGKIPLIGALFRRKNKKAVKTNLMIFLRPKIIREHRDISGFTQKRYEKLQKSEEASQPDTKRMIHGETVPVLPDVIWEGE